MATYRGRMAAAGMGFFYGLGQSPTGANLQTLRNQLALAKSHLSAVRGTTATYPGKRGDEDTDATGAYITFSITKTYGEIMGLTPVAGGIARGRFGNDPTNKFVPTAVYNRVKTAVDTAQHNVKAIEEQIAQAENAGTHLVPAGSEDAVAAQATAQVEAQWQVEMENAQAERQAALEANRAVLTSRAPMGPTSVNEALAPSAEEEGGSRLLPILLVGGGAAALFFLTRG